MLSSLHSLVSKAVNPHYDVVNQATNSVNSIPMNLSENYRLFASKWRLQSVAFSNESGDIWYYFDTNEHGIPLIMIPGTTGTAIVFFQQMLSLSLRGYRLISVTIPCTSSVDAFNKSFNKFLSFLHIDTFHLLGTSLGGFLALSYTNQHPQRVLSLILTNSFADTHVFQTVASSWMSSELMPEFYLRRYITHALPKHAQQSIQMALATEFVLKQIDTLNKQQLSARLALNFSKNAVHRLHKHVQQENITIIDTVDQIALDHEQRDRLYTLLNRARYSLMKYGGDFPYLSNHEEYTMLIQVHLRRYDQHGVAAAIRSTPTATPTTNTTSDPTQTQTQSSPTLVGVFDHRRNYHQAQKRHLFEDDHAEEHKDGVVLNDYGSDSSQSSGFNDVQYTEDDKRKSMLIHKNKEEEWDDQADADAEAHIVGVEHRHYEDDDGDKRQNNDEQQQSSWRHHHAGETDENHTDFYLITDDKKRQYLEDRRIKKQRYKEYLQRKKKAYKKYLRQKHEHEHGDADNDDNDDDDDDDDEPNPKNVNTNVSTQKKKQKKKKKKKKKSKEHSKSLHKKNNQKHKSKKRKKPQKHSASEKKARKAADGGVESVEKIKAKMREYYNLKKFQNAMPDGSNSRDRTISNIVANRSVGDLPPTVNRFASINQTVIDHGSNFADMVGHDDFIPERDRNYSLLSVADGTDRQIVEVGSALISPRNSVGNASEDGATGDEQGDLKLGSSSNEHGNNNIHRKQGSILNALSIHPIREDAAGEDEDDDEKKIEEHDMVQQHENRSGAVHHKARNSRHRTLRRMHHDEDDHDQTPMELALNERGREKGSNPATVGGHRYIPSYDSQMSNTDVLDLERGRTSSNRYVPYYGNDADHYRNESLMSDAMGDYEFIASEIQEWPMEGSDGAGGHPKDVSVANMGGYTPVAHRNYSGANASLLIISKDDDSNHNMYHEHQVEHNDENVGDSIF